MTGSKGLYCCEQSLVIQGAMAGIAAVMAARLVSSDQRVLWLILHLTNDWYCSVQYT